MDDTAQNDQNQPVSPSQGGPQISQPVSIPQKEQEGLTNDYLKASEVHPKISKELEEAGVETVSEVPQITIEHVKAGLEPAKESVPVQTMPQGLVSLPITQTQAQNILNLHKKVTESVAWLAMLILRQFQIAQSKKAND